MKYKSVLLLAAFLVGTSLGHSQPRVASGPQPFHVSSRGTGNGVQTELEGTFVVNAESIGVSVTKATIYVSEHCPYQGRRSVNQLKLGLAAEVDPEGKWKLESAGLPLLLNLVMSPKEEYFLRDLSFLIPKEGNTDLSKRWFVAEIQTNVLDVPDQRDQVGYVFAFSCKDVFVPLDCKKAKR